MLKNTKHSWGLISQLLHWLTALFIFVAVVMVIIATDMEDSPEKLKLFVLHKSFGITTLVLVMMRLFWKCIQQQPQPAIGISKRNHQFAQFGHWLLYILMLLVPLSGWVINSAANYPFRWMNLFSVPNLPFISPSLQSMAVSSHVILFLLLWSMVCAHVVLALVHKYLNGSDLIQRMAPKINPIIYYFSFIVLGIYFSCQFIPSAGNDTEQMNAVAIDKPSHHIFDHLEHTDHQWNIVKEKSKLEFKGSYEGEIFKGEFRKFDAELFFDVKNPEMGFFNVVVDVNSITTYSDDFDSSLLEEDWFFVSQYPVATFKTIAMTQSERGYSAKAWLTIKGIRKRVVLDFSWIENQDSTVYFYGTTTLDRTDFLIGSGVWSQDETIGFSVVVDVSLVLNKYPIN